MKELDYLSSLFRYYDLKPEKFEAFCETVKETILGHLAGGRDREGKEFLTVYCGEQIESSSSICNRLLSQEKRDKKRNA